MSVLHLQFVRPDGETETYHLKGVRRYRIGRGSQSEVRILDMKMSRQHCAIEERDGQWILVDLGSTNGARVDGSKIDEQTELKPGNRISAGVSVLEVLCINDSLDLDASAIVDLAMDQADVGATAKAEQAPTVAIESRSGPESGGPQAGSGTWVQDEIPEVENDIPHTVPDNPFEAEPQEETGDPPPNALSRRGKRGGRTSGPVVGTPEAAKAQTRHATAQHREPSAPAKESTTTRGHFITVLGQRVGPLTRSQARELKAKELKGQLDDRDLTDLPRA